MSSPSPPDLGSASVSAVFVYVHDLVAMRRFYVETLGFAAQFENERIAMLQGKGGAQIVLHSGRKGGHGGDPHWFIELTVSGLDALCAELGRRGVKIAPIHDAPYGRTTTFLDPEGNKIGLEEPARR